MATFDTEEMKKVDEMILREGPLETATLKSTLDQMMTAVNALEAGGTAATAATTTYDNESSGLTADNAQEAIDEIWTLFRNTDAAGVPYDNSASGFTATDVQAAIDEVALYAYPVTVINTSATGTHADDATLIGGRIVSIVPVSGAESAVKASSVTAQGGISLELVEAQAAGDAVFACYCQKIAPVA